MKIEQTFTVPASRAAVWSRIQDPAFVGPCIPDVSSIEVLGADEYKAFVAVEIGPIRTGFNLVVSVTERAAPERMAFRTRGEEGSRASILGAESALVLRVLGEAETEVYYSSDVSVTGRLGKFGLGLMKKKADEYGARFARNFREAIVQAEER